MSTATTTSTRGSVQLETCEHFAACPANEYLLLFGYRKPGTRQATFEGLFPNPAEHLKMVDDLIASGVTVDCIALTVERMADYLAGDPAWDDDNVDEDYETAERYTIGMPFDLAPGAFDAICEAMQAVVDAAKAPQTFADLLGELMAPPTYSLTDGVWVELYHVEQNWTCDHEECYVTEALYKRHFKHLPAVRAKIYVAPDGEGHYFFVNHPGPGRWGVYVACRKNGWTRSTGFHYGVNIGNLREELGLPARKEAAV